MSTYPVEFKDLEEENKKLKDENELRRVVLVDTQEQIEVITMKLTDIVNMITQALKGEDNES